MRSILHDWDDTLSIKILKSLAAAMKGRQAKLVLIEQVCPVLQHDAFVCQHHAPPTTRTFFALSMHGAWQTHDVENVKAQWANGEWESLWLSWKHGT